MATNTCFESQRCLFRRIVAEDFSRLRLLEADPAVVRQTGLRTPQTLQDTQARLERTLKSAPDLEPFGIWLVLSKKNPEDLVGWVMLMKRDLPYPEVGYMLPQLKWGQGYATEIVRRIIEYGIETIGIKAFSARTDLDNYASIKVLEKAGFKRFETVDQVDNPSGCNGRVHIFYYQV